MQDVTVTTFLTCAPNRSLPSDHLDFEDIAIAADGSFTATRTQNGVLAGVPAQFTYSVRGQFNPTNVTGTLRQDVTFTDGSTYSCTTNDQSWSAQRTAQGSQAADQPLPGSYSGQAPQHSSYLLTFHVAPDSQSLQDVTVTTFLACSPNRAMSNEHLDSGAQRALAQFGRQALGPIERVGNGARRHTDRTRDGNHPGPVRRATGQAFAISRLRSEKNVANLGTSWERGRRRCLRPRGGEVR